MAATSLHQSLGTFQSRGCVRNMVLNHDYSTGSLRLMANVFKFDVDLPRLITHFSRKMTFVHASASQATTSDAVYNPLNDSITEIPSSKIVTETKKKSKEASLILIRHGESMWNEKNLFTGCVDVPLTQKGVDEAIEVGKRISNIHVDIIYTPALIRGQMTAMLAMLAMTQHRRKKVTIVMHKESDQAREWSQILSEETNKQCIPVVIACHLNERM